MYQCIRTISSFFGDLSCLWIYIYIRFSIQFSRWQLYVSFSDNQYMPLLAE